MSISPAKPKRRSSFVRGRRSGCKLYPDLKNTDLEIPNDLPLVDKCMRLGLQTLEQSLEKHSNEFPDLDELQQFNVHVKDAVTSRLEEWRAEQKSNLKPNPVNLAIDRQMKEIPIYMDKLKKEDDRWEELLKARQELAEKAQNLAETVSDTPIEASPECMKRRDTQLLDSIPDYDDIHRDTHSLFDRNSLMTDGLLNSVTRLARVKDCAERVQLDMSRQFCNDVMGTDGRSVTDILFDLLESNISIEF